MADVVEALIGALYLSSGDQGTRVGFEFLQQMGIIKHATLPAYVPMHDARLGDHLLNAYARMLAPVEQRVGYQFKSKALLVQAFTHASYRAAVTPSYERLEFLGDALLDFVTSRHNYLAFPYIRPSDLHELKISCTNNGFLAEVARKYGFHKHIMHQSPQLTHDVLLYANVAPDDVDKSPFESDLAPPKVCACTSLTDRA